MASRPARPLEARVLDRCVGLVVSRLLQMKASAPVIREMISSENGLKAIVMMGMVGCPEMGRSDIL